MGAARVKVGRKSPGFARFHAISARFEPWPWQPFWKACRARTWPRPRRNCRPAIARARLRRPSPPRFRRPPMRWRACPPPLRPARAVFARLGEVMPGFAPQSLLDVGAGTGAASWAAVTQWPDIAGLSPCWIAIRPCAALARRLVSIPVLWRMPKSWPATSARKSRKRRSGGGELCAGRIAARPGGLGSARSVAERPSGALALIEPGTPHGFARIRSRPRRADRGRRACRRALHP